MSDTPRNTSIDPASPSLSSSLSPAYPNPFSANTSFTLNVDRPQQVQVSVYNTLGQRTRTLFDGPVHPNEPMHISLEGAHLPSGLYVIRAEGEDFMAMQKVIRIQ